MSGNCTPDMDAVRGGEHAAFGCREGNFYIGREILHVEDR